MSDDSQQSAKDVAGQGEARDSEDPQVDQTSAEEHAASKRGRIGPAGEEVREVTARERKRLNRRQLLKLIPVVAIGAFAIPKLQEPLLVSGLHFSDWASGLYFGRKRLARTFSDNEVVPFERFPY